MDLRAVQAPIKERYREDAGEARITLTARAGEADAPVACSVEAGRAIQAAEAHLGVGGPGTGACSGDLLLGALAACAQVTCQMVAASMGLETTRIEVAAEGELDLRGTLGVSRDASVGFERIRLRLEIDAPGARADEIESLKAKTERYCTVLQTLTKPPAIETTLEARTG
ncbi:MAG TPA: OsmC family protein [Solirubrobacterales bacterium]|nr:OsmC family protein [Solirubrobacterales bacterium]